MPDRPSFQFRFAVWPRMTLLTTMAGLLLCIVTHGDEPPQTITPQLITQQSLRNGTARKTNDSDPSSTVTFFAMGDVPYAPEEDLLLPKQIANLPTLT